MSIDLVHKGTQVLEQIFAINKVLLASRCILYDDGLKLASFDAVADVFMGRPVRR